MGGIRVEGSLPPTLFVEERERWGWGGADVIDNMCARDRVGVSEGCEWTGAGFAT